MKLDSAKTLSDRWMSVALALAREAAGDDEVPIGAVVVHEGKIVGRGRNRREKGQDPLGHAELVAIAEAARALGTWRLGECSLVVTLEPCPMCLAACQQARIGSVVFGALDPKGGALSLGYRVNEDARTNHRFPVEHVDAPESATLLREFFKQKRV